MNVDVDQNYLELFRKLNKNIKLFGVDLMCSLFYSLRDDLYILLKFFIGILIYN